MVKLTSKNLDTFRRVIKISKLLKTFQNAITVAMFLGVRHIWINSLCNIQDCKEDGKAKVPHMLQVYQNVIFNVSATHSPKSQVSLIVR
ncbi:hypothetical protein K432DRAFT_308863 [Lepidopterella palustris CBS 459.81]|uniref:Heterokaryon incompatibility domain-containing protein n=1 Tax=Lepidopterella palustris CBS 459.81 TaxID=1314670 RepID=A0A8E2E0T2_9PEZI|nr:hypothetical protein K432DRAFT_308863 [Lepidopterella palustris CBS 459.81]